MQRYYYHGPVMEFGNCRTKEWDAETVAQSEIKARSNFKYQYKKSHNLIAASKIELPGKIIAIGGY